MSNYNILDNKSDLGLIDDAQPMDGTVELYSECGSCVEVEKADIIALARHFDLKAEDLLGKRVTCTSCFGSGIYDDTGSPPCGACNGTGNEHE